MKTLVLPWQPFVFIFPQCQRWSSRSRKGTREAPSASTLPQDGSLSTLPLITRSRSRWGGAREMDWQVDDWWRKKRVYSRYSSKDSSDSSRSSSFSRSISISTSISTIVVVKEREREKKRRRRERYITLRDPVVIFFLYSIFIHYLFYFIHK